MNTKIYTRKLMTKARTAFLVTIAFALVLLTGSLVAAQSRVPKGKAFPTTNEAAQAFIAAAENYDEAALTEILGPNSYDLIHSGDAVADRQISMDFAKLAREKMTLLPDKRNPNLVILQVGNDLWPSPIPLVRRGGKWYFDAAAGRQEILYRRVGRNEIDAIKLCRGFVEAQNEYALSKHDGAAVNQYAQKIIATSGRQDGLAWQNADGTWAGPAGENVAKAIAAGYTSGKSAPYHGYYFKLLRGQGPAAPHGAMDYMVHGYMLGGYALIAYPATYRFSGVKSFMVSQDGVVYEKDLGPNTLDKVKAIEVFNPDKTWKPVLKDPED